MKCFIWLVAGLVAGCMPHQKPNETAAAVDAPQDASALVSPSQPTMPPGYFPASLAETTIVCDPSGGIKPFAVLSPFTNSWYSAHLSAAQEPSIYKSSSKLRSKDGRIMRFSLLPSFSHSIFIRIDATGSIPKLIATELTGTSGWDPGGIGRRIDRDLTEAEYKKIDSLLSASQVLRMAPIDCELGLDGSRWIIETADNAGYRFIDRWSPESGPVREVGETLLALTGWN